MLLIFTNHSHIHCFFYTYYFFSFSGCAYYDAMLPLMQSDSLLNKFLPFSGVSSCIFILWSSAVLPLTISKTPTYKF